MDEHDVAERVIAPRTSRRAPLWAEVDPGFHVGSDRRAFLGSVSTAPGEGYCAFGARSEFLGRFDDLRAAKEAVALAA